MTIHSPKPESGRETRLLLLVVGVAVAVLLVLAQLRFPEADRSVATPSAAPLAGLAARATFDEMGNTIADVLGRVSSSVVEVALADKRDVPQSLRKDRPPLAGETSPRSTHRVIGLRIGSNAALVHLPAGLEAVDSLDSSQPLPLLSSDATRELALVQVAATDGSQDLLAGAVRSFPGLSYVVVLESSPAGPTIQPVFVGRIASTIDPRWSHPLITVGPAPHLTVGSFVFSLTGRLIGLVIRTNDGDAVVPAQALETMVSALLSPGTPP